MGNVLIYNPALFFHSTCTDQSIEKLRSLISLPEEKIKVIHCIIHMKNSLLDQKLRCQRKLIEIETILGLAIEF